MVQITVCILTAGKGSRMGPIGQALNKALLPIDGKAVISHIINKFPANTNFVIGLGYLGIQVRNYLQIAHPDRRFKFVNIDNHDGPRSGPGHSLLCCKKYLQKPFYFVSCDTLWEKNLDFSITNNWMGVARVDAIESSRYCNFEVVDNKIVGLIDKSHVSDPSYRAFVGLCHIYDFHIFWKALGNNNLVAGEHQISNGIKALIENVSVFSQDIIWNDVGDAEKYKEMVGRYENFDFSKSNEALYIINGKVIKFFVDSEIANKRVIKSKLNQPVFPKITHYQDQFYSYEFQSGKTLYQVNDQNIFHKFLEFLVNNLWHPHKVESKKMLELCHNFYYIKTQERLALFSKKYPYTNINKRINGEIIPPIVDLFNALPWKKLEDGVPCFIHGDLQFDNALYDRVAMQFTLLDWRQDFGGEIEYGDLYYDLAKLYGGIILNYDYIKLNLFSYSEDENNIHFDFAQRYQSDFYLKILSDFIENRGYDLNRVKLLVSLVYLNMAPLHQQPFDKLLHALGRYMLYQQIRTSK